MKNEFFQTLQYRKNFSQNLTLIYRISVILYIRVNVLGKVFFDNLRQIIDVT